MRHLYRVVTTAHQRKKRRERHMQPIIDRALKIMWITDTHMSATVTDNPNAAGARSTWPDSVVGPREYWAGRGKLEYFVDRVNEQNPDLAIHTGDSIDGNHSDTDFQLFVSEWNKIDTSIEKNFTRGNHDIAPNTINIMGVDQNDEIAGSKFNRSFRLENDNVAIRVINISTHLGEDENDGFTGGTSGRVYPYQLNWIKSEIENSSEELVLILSHAGLYLPNAYFNDGQTHAFLDMIDSLSVKKPIHVVGGHQHSGVTEYRSHSVIKGRGIEMFTGHQIPTATNQGTGGQYGVIYVTEDYDFIVELEDLHYKTP